MSPEEYWHGSSELTRAYAKAYRIRKEERNFELWLQGLYFFIALSTTLNNILTSGEPQDYISEPLTLFKTEEEYERERMEKEAEQLEATLNAFAERVKTRDERS